MEQKLKNEILGLIENKFDIRLYDLKLTKPPKGEDADFAFNCGVLSRDLKKRPDLIASEILDDLEEIDFIEKATSTAGFINIKLNVNIFTDIFTKLYDDYINNTDYFNVGNTQKIVVDYIGANVGKPLHIGHMCTPNQGQAMINVYKKLGYEVISDSHIGDWGIIFGKLITAYKLWGDETKLKEDAVNYLLELYVKITEEAEEKGDIIEQKTRDEFKLLSEGNSESVELWKEFTSYSIEAMNKQLARLNVKPDFNIGESFYEGLGLPKIEKYPDLKYDMHYIVEELVEKGIATKNEDNSVGVIFDEKLNIPSCILQKKDGTHGYLASDLAAIKYRLDNWNPAKIIYFVDSRQQMHLKQAFEISKKAGWIVPHPNPLPGGEVIATELFHAYNGFISLKDGAMSSRKGRIIKLDVLLDEAEKRAEKIILEKRDDLDESGLEDLSKIIGIGAIKYGYLKKSRETDVVFDWDEFMSFEGNSGPYIQYAYVRAIRILEKSNFSSLDKVEISEGKRELFINSEEIELIKLLDDYKNILLQTSVKNTPHLVCKYSYDLTKAFNAFYNNISVLNEPNEDKKLQKLKLVYLFSKILKDSFEIIGIQMPDKM